MVTRLGFCVPVMSDVVGSMQQKYLPVVVLNRANKLNMEGIEIEIALQQYRH
jgi:hypothetical protein